MAWLELDPSGTFHVGFRLGERKFKRSLRTSSSVDAERLAARLEENLVLVGRGRLELPEGADPAQFLLSDGKLNSKLRLPRRLTLESLFDAYFSCLPEGSLEATTIDGMKIHERQLYRILGKSFAIQQLSTSDLQRYIGSRSKESGRRGRKVSTGTIKKAIVTLRTVWNWGVRDKHLTGQFPNKDLKYPKGTEKPDFQTWTAIEQQIARGGLSAVEQADLWDCVFLTLAEIDDFVGYVKQHARQPWIYPAVCLAAHTGARRSEIIRSKPGDIDLAAGSITINERKRKHTTRTTRRVPLSPFLIAVLRQWLSQHPGGQYTFIQTTTVARSKKERKSPTQVTPDEAHDHFKRTLEDSKWSVVRGWHVLRHSFCSNCAAAGVDQRVINEWVGHQTEDMVKRYRHLFPDTQRAAIIAVFGKGEGEKRDG